MEHHRDSVSANVSHFRSIHLQKVLAFEEYLASDGSARRIRDQAHYRERVNTFAATALSHHPQNLTFLQRVRDSVDCLDHTILGEEVGGEVFYLK